MDAQEEAVWTHYCGFSEIVLILKVCHTHLNYSSSLMKLSAGLNFTEISFFSNCEPD